MFFAPCFFSNMFLIMMDSLHPYGLLNFERLVLVAVLDKTFKIINNMQILCNEPRNTRCFTNSVLLLYITDLTHPVVVHRGRFAIVYLNL